ncbi:MAG: MFS transporter [Granulosicoccus sp.]|nr:MFS transporter [Granulosicoccus sp.]
MRIRVVVAAFLTQAIIIGCMFSYGVFFKILEEEMGWSRTILSASSSVAFLTMGVLAIVGGRLNDRYGPRWVLSISGVLTGLGYVLMSQVTESWQLLIFFGLFIGVGLSTHDVVTLSTVASWFDKRRGAMTGVVKTGTACGQMILPVVATLLVSIYGWRSALIIIGVGVAASLLLISQWMRRPTENKAAAQQVQSEVWGLSFAQAKRTRILWTLCAIQFCFFPALMTIPLHILVHATDLGMTTVKAATVLSLIGGSSILGRLSIGMLLDKLGGRTSLIFCLLPLALSLGSLLIIENPSNLYLFALAYGIAHGGLFTVVSPTVAEYFGMKAHGAIFGVILFFGTLGGAAGPLLAGVLFDLLGSYQLTFALLSALALAGLLLAISLRKPALTT